MPILTAAQIEKLAEIIRQHATWLTWRLLGNKYVSKDEIDKLKTAGILPMETQTPAIKYAFVLGELESLLKEAEWKGLSFDDLVEAATARHTDVQKLQIQASELTAYTTLRGLEDDIKNGLYQSLARATQQTINEGVVKDIVKDETKLGIEMDKNFRQVANELAEKTKEYKRNWHRVASTELHAARQNGVASAIINGVDIYEHADGVDSGVSVVPAGDACKDCIRLYVDPKTGQPKIFKLSELLANAGTNYIKPWRKNVKPVIPPTHPHCFCRLSYVPAGWSWNEKGRLTLTEPEKVVEKVRARLAEKGKVSKGVDILRKAQDSHELLESSNKVAMPTEDEVSGIKTVVDIHSLLDRIHKLKKLHSDDYELWQQLDNIEAMTLKQDGILERGGAYHGQAQ
jgi:hypothetical protein